MTAKSNVLLIEDEDLLRMELQRILEAHNFTVCSAANGRDGLRALTESTFDVVITDILMPEKEGLETIIEIKRRWPATKIIAMSGMPDSEGGYLSMASHFGAMKTLTKPFLATELVCAVREALESDDPLNPA